MALELPVILFIISVTVSVCYPIMRHLPTHVSRWLEERRTKGWGLGRRRKKATAPQTIRVKPATHLGKRAHDLTAVDMARSDYFGGAGGGDYAATRKKQRRRQGRGGGKGEKKRRNKVSAEEQAEEQAEEEQEQAAEGAALSQQRKKKMKNAPIIGTPFSGGAFVGRAGCCSEPLRDDRTGAIVKSLVAPLHSRHGIQRDAFGNKRPETMRMPIHDDAYFAGVGVT